MNELIKIDFIVDPNSISTNQEILDKALAQLEEKQNDVENTNPIKFYYGFVYDTRSEAKHHVFPDATVTEYTLGKNIFRDDEVIPNIELPAEETTGTNKQYPDLGYEYITSTPNNVETLVGETTWNNTLVDDTTYKQVQIQIVSSATVAQIKNNELSVNFYNDTEPFYPAKTSMIPDGTIVDFIPVGLNNENLTFNITKSAGIEISLTNIKLWIKDSVIGVITIDSITADNHLDGAEQDTLTTLIISGTATAGAVKNGDDVKVSLNNELYTTTVANGIWSVEVNINDLKDDLSMDVVVESKDEDGFTVLSTTSHNHTIDVRYGTVTMNPIDGNNLITGTTPDPILITGTAVGGIIENGDEVTFRYGIGTAFTTTTVNNNSWTVSLPKSRFISGKTVSVSVNSFDIANYNIISNSEDYTIKWAVFLGSSASTTNRPISDGFYFGSSVAAALTRSVYAWDPLYGPDSGGIYIGDNKTHSKMRVEQPGTNLKGAEDGSLGISENILVIGNYRDETNGRNSGAAYIYDITDAHMYDENKVTVVYPPSGAAANDYFGWAAAANDTHVAIGAFSYGLAGAVFVYDKNGNHLTTIEPSDGVDGDGFGRDIDISSNKIIVSSYLDGGKGSIYIYDLDGSNEFKKNGDSIYGILDGDRFGTNVQITDTHYGASAGGSNDTTYIFSLADMNGAPIHSKPGDQFVMNSTHFLAINVWSHLTLWKIEDGQLRANYTLSSSTGKGSCSSASDATILFGEPSYSTTTGRVWVVK